MLKKSSLTSFVFGFARLSSLLSLGIAPALASIVPTSDSGPTSDPLSNYQWALLNTGQAVTEDLDDIHSRQVQGKPGIDIGVAKIRAQLASRMTRDVLVAVIDSGISFKHPDVAGVIFKNTSECDSAGDIPFQPDSDKDGNGYKGDCMGWNFTAGGAGDNRPEDDVGHGTHVAGVIAGISDNAYGIAGVAPAHVRILPIKVTSSQDSQNGGSTQSSDFTDRVAKAIRYATRMKADVINMSLGWPRSIDTDDVRAAIHEAAAAGVTLVAAAGNNHSGRPIVPCSLDEVICVGAIEADGSLADFSNFGGVVDILAPGAQILSTIPQTIAPVSFGIQGFDIKNGTSQAAPFVTAAVAILKGALGPISNAEVRARLMLSSRKILSPAEASGGLLQIEGALAQQPAPFVHPVFKGLDLIPVQLKSRSFSFELPIRNDWIAAKNVTVDLSVTGSSVKLSKSRFQFATLGRDQSQSLTVSGTVSDSGAASEITLGVKVTAGASAAASTSYSQTLILTRAALDDSEAQVTPVPGLDGNAAVQLQTVTDPYQQLETPEYYVPAAAADGLHVRIFRKDGGAYSSREIVVPKATKILSIERLDLDGDGKPDYWIYAVSMPAPNANGRAAPAAPFLILGYLDQALKPLFGNGYFTYQPEAVVPDLSAVSFVPFMVESKYLKFPVFNSTGSIPRLDRNTDPFAREDLSRRSHLYYLVPNLSNPNAPTVDTRIVDRFDFRDKFRADHSLAWDDEISIVSAASQGKAAFDSGHAGAYLSAGSRFPKSYFRIDVTAGAAISVVPLNLGSFFIGGAQVKSMTEIPTGSGAPAYLSGTAFMGFQSQDTVSYAWIASDGSFSQASFQNDLSWDPLVGSIAIFNQGSENVAFFSANSRIVVQATSPSGAQVVSHPLTRSSFVPGKVFTETLTPILVGTGASIRPALYMDSTQLLNGSLSVIEYSNGELVSRIRNTLQVPERCISMNPVTVGGVYSFSLLCHEADGSFALRHLPIR